MEITVANAYPKMRDCIKNAPLNTPKHAANRIVAIPPIQLLGPEVSTTSFHAPVPKTKLPDRDERRRWLTTSTTQYRVLSVPVQWAASKSDPSSTVLA